MNALADLPRSGKTEHLLRREAEAARDLIAMVRSEGAGGDEELMADAIEGETDLLEAIAAALAEIDESDVLILGGKEKIRQLEARVASEERRVERMRAAVERAIVMSEIPTPIRFPTATIGITRRAPQAVIDDEAAIPARFFIEQPRPAPKLDKKALAAAMKDGPIPGAHLDNGTISLSVRRS